MRRRLQTLTRIGRRTLPSPEWLLLVGTLALGVALSAVAVGRHLSVLLG